MCWGRKEWVKEKKGGKKGIDVFFSRVPPALFVSFFVCFVLAWSFSFVFPFFSQMIRDDLIRAQDQEKRKTSAWRRALASQAFFFLSPLPDALSRRILSLLFFFLFLSLTVIGIAIAAAAPSCSSSKSIHHVPSWISSPGVLSPKHCRKCQSVSASLPEAPAWPSNPREGEDADVEGSCENIDVFFFEKQRESKKRVTQRRCLSSFFFFFFCSLLFSFEFSSSPDQSVSEQRSSSPDRRRHVESLKYVFFSSETRSKKSVWSMGRDKERGKGDDEERNASTEEEKQSCCCSCSWPFLFDGEGSRRERDRASYVCRSRKRCFYREKWKQKKGNEKRFSSLCKEEEKKVGKSENRNQRRRSDFFFDSLSLLSSRSSKHS